jgi:hypothetical protein
MKQTSIEWLLEKIEQKNGAEFSSYYVKFIKQAKEMHKQEIEDAFQDGKWELINNIYKILNK